MHRRRTLFDLAAVTTLVAAAALVASAFAGCSGGSDAAPTAGGGAGQGGSAALGGGGTGGTIDPPVYVRATITGDITWVVDFDAVAEGNGATDCSYTRHYVGVEDESAPWLCPSCTIMFRADVEMTAGLQDCFPQVSAATPPPVEWLGYSADGAFWRSSGFPMTEQGTTTPTATGFDTANVLLDQPIDTGGVLAFDIAGSMTVDEDDGDPLAGWRPPASYACGWPKADPPPYQGDYLVVPGQTVPDGVFKDACDEVVRLHDFRGSYLLIDMSARDCPPCQLWASQEDAFATSMHAQGIDVHVVTLLAPSLNDVIGETTLGMLTYWTNKYALSSPVLADRAWGLAMFEPALGVDNVAYPSWVLVRPDLSVVSFGAGFASFAEFETAIVADAGP